MWCSLLSSEKISSITPFYALLLWNTYEIICLMMCVDYSWGDDRTLCRRAPRSAHEIVLPLLLYWLNFFVSGSRINPNIMVSFLLRSRQISQPNLSISITIFPSGSFSVLRRHWLKFVRRCRSGSSANGAVSDVFCEYARTFCCANIWCLLSNIER